MDGVRVARDRGGSRDDRRRGVHVEVTDRERLLDLLKRYGWNATSFQALEPEFDYWFDGDDAAVAYFDTGRAWVVAGPPVAPYERLAEVGRRFAREAARHRRRVAFFAVERRFLAAIDMAAVAIGEQPRWDPRLWSERHRGHRSLKEQLRRARAKGVVVERVGPADLDIAAIDRLIGRWRESRVMPPMTFLVELHPFIFAEERRYYVARARGELVGILVAVPVYLRNGWFFEDILRDPCAPNGTAEALVHAAMTEAAADGSEFVTLGLAPLAGSASWLRFARGAMRGFYNFGGLHAFKSKLRPDEWDPIYVAWPDGATALTAIFDSLDAFAGGAIVSFAIRSIFRAPSPVLFTLGALLVPWVALMASVDPKRWFPSRAVQFGWLAFDCVMCGVLVSLSTRWRQKVAIGAFAAASFDAALTAVEASSFRPRRNVDYAIMAAAVAAPALAAAILLGGIRRSSAAARRAAASRARGPAAAPASASRSAAARASR